MKRPIRMAAAVAALAVAATEVVPIGAVDDKVVREQNRAKTTEVWNNRGALARKTLSYKSNGDTIQVNGDRKRLSNDSLQQKVEVAEEGHQNHMQSATLSGTETYVAESKERPDSKSSQSSSKTLSKGLSSSQRQLGSTRAQRLGARAKANKLRPLRDMHNSNDWSPSWDRPSWDRPSWDRPQNWSQSWSSGRGGGSKSGKRSKRGKGTYSSSNGGKWGNVWGGRADCWDYKPTYYPTVKNEDLEPTLAPSLNPTMNPTINPTLFPTMSPNLSPTMYPTLSPTQGPSNYPTLSPSLSPTNTPTLSPSLFPTLTPTGIPDVRDVGSPLQREEVPANEAAEFDVLAGSSPAPPLPNPLRVVSITRQSSIGRCSITSNQRQVVYIPRRPEGGGNQRCSYSVCDSRDVCQDASVWIEVMETPEPTLTPSLSPTLSPTLSPSLGPTLSPTLSPSLGPSMHPTISPSLSPTLSPVGTPVANNIGSATNRQQVPINEVVEFLVLNSATAAPPLPNALRVESITNQANRGSCEVTADEQRVEFTPRAVDGVGNARCGYQICDSRDVCAGATVYINVVDVAQQAPRTSGNDLNVEDIPDTEGNRSVPADTANGENLVVVVGTVAAVEQEQGGKQDDELIKQDNDDDIFTWKDESDSRRLTEERELSGRWQFWGGRDQWNSNSWGQPSWGGSKSSKTSSNGRRKRQYYWDDDDDDGRVWGKIKGSAKRRCKY